jgi:hypothetical protein
MKKKHKQLLVALILTCAFITIVPVGVFYMSSVPNIIVPNEILGYTVGYWKNAGYPVLSMNFNCLLTSQGSLSVNNPVNVFVGIWDVNASNPSNFLASYDGIAFTYGYRVNSTGNPTQYPSRGFIPITKSKVPNYNYTAQGQVTWLVPGPTWIYFLPNTTCALTVKYNDVESPRPAIATLADATDTISIQNGIRTEQLNWILLGVGILAFQPIISAFIPDDKPEHTLDKKLLNNKRLET